jgi:hypothetical protein
VAQVANELGFIGTPIIMVFEHSLCEILLLVNPKISSILIETGNFQYF